MMREPLPYCPCGECPLDPAFWTPECRLEAGIADLDDLEKVAVRNARDGRTKDEVLKELKALHEGKW